MIAKRARMGSAIENVETIATRVATAIEKLKPKFPHYQHFSAEERLHQNIPQLGIEAGAPGNPQLFTISYHNGIHSVESQAASPLGALTIRQGDLRF